MSYMRKSCLVECYVTEIINKKNTHTKYELRHLINEVTTVKWFAYIQIFCTLANSIPNAQRNLNSIYD